MNYIKFESNFTFILNSGETVLVQRNTIVEYLDKYESFVYNECEACGNSYQWNYKIKVYDEYFYVPQGAVTEINPKEIINKDYTEKEFKESVMEDALVKDGNYVKAWIKTLGISKPVKNRADQCDYAWSPKINNDETEPV